LLGWGALAFGGSPTWAAASIAVLALTTGILGFLERSRTSSAKSPAYRAVMAAVALVLLAVTFQLVPLSKGLADRLSPARNNADYERLLAQAGRRDPALVQRAPEAPAPVSIAPSRTALGLTGLAALAILLVGASHGLATIGTLGIVRAVAALGVMVAMVGLYQLTTDSRLVYGWYVPLFTTGRSAPFLNPNHQAGWLVMALSLTLGAFAGDVARGMSGVAPNWRARILWLSSKDASVAVLMLFSAAVIAAGILAAGSRGGALAMILTFLIVAGWNSRRQRTKVRRVSTAAGLTALGLTLLAFNGQGVLQEISQTEGPGIRRQLWQDTLRIANDFWLVGSGFNTYGTAMLHYQTVKDGFRYVEAHNDYLQLAAEGGLLVGLPFIVFISVLIVDVRRRFTEGADDARTYWVRVGAVTGIIGMALQSIADFTLQMPGAAVMFTTLVAIAIHHPPARVVSRVREDR
jgi:O-antigen ligase